MKIHEKELDSLMEIEYFCYNELMKLFFRHTQKFQFPSSSFSENFRSICMLMTMETRAKNKTREN